MTEPPAADVKACCAAAYGSDLVALLLGDSYHPGGQALTRRLARHLELPAGSRVLDVASGPGTTATLLARDFGLQVTGVDLAAANVALARGRTAAEGLEDRVTFTVGDAERLPCPDAAFDAVVIECALCTFPDKHAAASEIARVLRPAGRLGLTDVVAHPSRLPAELTTLSARVACIADALPAEGYAALLDGTGLSVTHAERHDAAVTRMIDQIEARLTVLRMTARARLDEFGLDAARAAPVLDAARSAVGDGVLGYGLFVAEKARVGL
ncbi:MAG: class I SAM-dependent methyltransferase [Actinomycetota bacterium]